MCAKTVTDYSNMTDAEVFASISKYGLSCGKFRDDQLNRELLPVKKRKNLRFFYLPLLATLFFKPAHTRAQSVPDTVQLPHVGCKQPSYDRLENKVKEQDELISYDNTPKRFGTGNVAVIKAHYQIPLTPFYVLAPKYWFRDNRGVGYVRIGKWHIPFIN